MEKSPGDMTNEIINIATEQQRKDAAVLQRIMDRAIQADKHMETAKALADQAQSESGDYHQRRRESISERKFVVKLKRGSSYTMQRERIYIEEEDVRLVADDWYILSADGLDGIMFTNSEDNTSFRVARDEILIEPYVKL